MLGSSVIRRRSVAFVLAVASSYCPTESLAADGGEVAFRVEGATGRVVAAMPEAQATDLAAPYRNSGPERRVRTRRAAVKSPAGAFLIDFDTLPDGGPLTEGTILSSQYAAFGVLFGGSGIAEDVTGAAGFFPGVSLPNYLTFGGYTPGPGAALGCIINLNASFNPAPAYAVTFDAFALAPLGLSGSLQVTARDGGGNIVDTDMFLVTAQLFSSLDAFSLTVFAPAIASIQLTGTDVCASIDNLMFTTLIPTEIDIRPGRDPNLVNPRSKGEIPVAILTTITADGDSVDFDALEVAPMTLAFGPQGAEITESSGYARDVDGDGDLDMVVRFKIRRTGITCGDTTATLTGETLGGQQFEGTDEIKTTTCH